MAVAILSWLRRRPWRRAVPVAAAGVALFFLYSFIPLTSPSLVSSPDEAANRFFATRLAETGTLHYLDSWNIFVPGTVHPRSTTVADNFIVPGGFVGLPVIFGGLAKVFGLGVLPFLTPLFAVLGVLGWGLLVARLLGRPVGIAAAGLLALHPVWWYVTARVFQPNVLFLTLTIWGSYFLVIAPTQGSFGGGATSRGRCFASRRFLAWADGAIAGILLALALAVRAAEAYWFILALAVIAVFRRGRLPWGRLVVAAAFGLLTLAPFLVINWSLYGNALATGYGAVGQATASQNLQGFGMRLLGPLQPYLFPLGFAPRTAAHHFWLYGVRFFLPWTAIVVAALIVLVKRRPPLMNLPRLTAAGRALAALSVVVAGWLILFYGSWTIYDNPDPDAVTIGSSYLRYWLPIFLLSTVPAAAAAAWLWGCRRNRLLLVALAVLLAGYFVVTVFGAAGEGLLAMRRELVRAESFAAEVLRLVPEGAIVVTDRDDKYLFPRRSVIVPLRSEATYDTLGRLAGRARLFYLGVTFPEKDLRWLNDTRLPPLGLRIEAMRDFGVETLYRFIPVRDGDGQGEAT
jgi:hypothetical protein